ncbi:hypothetical protein pipiens_015682 [Culex pipiens pipiens]|uniref:Reverse transcriptase n=1 Tax=Culex pipiens pipiens TaxID=38569 RepID=A0ABD1CPK0_CULPP
MFDPDWNPVNDGVAMEENDEVNQQFRTAKASISDTLRSFRKTREPLCWLCSFPRNFEDRSSTWCPCGTESVRQPQGVIGHLKSARWRGHHPAGSVGPNVPTYLTRLLRSYLSERKFRVHLPGAISEVQEVAAGVAQGSLIGPILYVLFTSDVPPLPAGCSLALYADDSAIVANGRTPTHYRSRLQQGVTADPLRHRPSPKLLPPPDCYLRVNGCIVPWMEEVIYLGLIFDTKLLYRAHTDSLKRRCSGLVKALYPLIARGSRLSLKNKLAIVKSVVAPVVNYAMPVWGKCAETHKRKLQVVQNRLLKIVLNAPFDTRTSELHRVSGCKTIQQRLEDSLDRLHLSATASEHPLIRALV